MAHLKSLRGNEEATKATVEKLTDICLNVSQQVKGKDKAALNAVRSALKTLNTVDLSTAGISTHGDLLNVLSNVIQKAQQLFAQLDEVVTTVQS